MTYKIAVVVCFVISLGFLGCASERYTQTSKIHSMRADTLRMMKIQDVIALLKAGVSDSLIISMMDATDSWFKLGTQDILDLKNAGVSEKVIAAMLQQPSEPSNQSKNTQERVYYNSFPYFWYFGYYPSWYYPLYSARIGYRFHHPGYFPHRRFR
jgi:hypothetical protein